MTISAGAAAADSVASASAATLATLRDVPVGGFSPYSPTPLNLVTRVMKLPPQAHSVMAMASAMALHFGGYEFARSANMALFTSTQTGFTGPTAFPLAMACVSPFSVILLMGYGRELERNGPRVALRHCTLLSIGVISSLGILISYLERHNIKLFSGKVPLAKVAVWSSFVFQNAYAHLLYTQHWSFIGSVLTPSQGATWFASIAGMSSITSTLAGSAVSRLVNRIGLTGLLEGTAICLVLSLLCADFAYSIAERNGFDPAEEIKQKKRKAQERASMKKGDEVDDLAAQKKKGILAKSLDLFQRVPTLGALFWEVFVFQSLSTILNLCFITKLKASIPDDKIRAAWTGNFWALVNAVSGVMQFGIMPLFMNRVEPSLVWCGMPLFPAICTVVQCFQDDPSLDLIAFSFFAAKVMDYSLRNVVNEMVYMPLDFESRYLGKEIIGVFGNRLGKSGMSVILAGLTFVSGRDFSIFELSQLTALASVSWWATTIRLSHFIPKKREAEAQAKSRQQEMPNTKKDR